MWNKIYTNINKITTIPLPVKRQCECKKAEISCEIAEKNEIRRKFAEKN